jgi:hypothetical protein
LDPRSIRIEKPDLKKLVFYPYRTDELIFRGDAILTLKDKRIAARLDGSLQIEIPDIKNRCLYPMVSTLSPRGTSLSEL